MNNDHYATAAASAALLRSGQKSRRDRAHAADMITAAEAASLMGVDGSTIATWIRSARCLGVAAPHRTLRLPRWQFEPPVWSLILPIGECLGTKDGWQVLSFLETPLGALSGLTPRVALEQGTPAARVLALATADS